MGNRDGSDKTVTIDPIRVPKPSHKVYPRDLENEEDAPTYLPSGSGELTVVAGHPGIEDHTTLPGRRLPVEVRNLVAPTVEDRHSLAPAVEEARLPDPTVENLTEDFESAETARSIEPLRTDPLPRLMASERYAHRRVRRRRRSIMVAVFGMLSLSILAVLVSSAFQPNRAVILRTEHE